MSTSTLSLYKNIKLEESRNFIVENLDGYLGTPDVISNFQYIKIGLTISIKINLSQTGLAFLSANNVNYISILQDTKTYYYYVISKAWTSESTIRYDLKMDVLNTFKWNVDYKPTEKTLVRREHKDRISKTKIGTDDLYYEFEDIIPQDTETGGLPNEIISYFYLKEIEPNLNLPLYSIYIDSYYIVDTISGDTLEEGTDYTIVDLSIDLTGYADFPDVVLDMQLNPQYDIGDLEFGFTIRYLINTSHPRLVDLKSEEINCLKYKMNDLEIHDKVNTSWLLHYLNRNNPDPTAYNDVNPVECHLLPKNSIKVQVPTTSGIIDTSVITSGLTFYYFRYYYSGDVVIDVDGEQFQIYNPTSFTYYGVSITNNAGVLKFVYFRIEDLGGVIGELYTEILTINNPTTITFVNAPNYVNVRKESGSASTNANYLFGIAGVGDYNYIYNTGTETSTTLVGAGVIDRTDAKNIKIIELPYSPTTIKDDGSLSPKIAECWTYDSGLGVFTLNDENANFNNNFVSDVINPLSDLKVVLPASITKNELRDDKYESKIYHSDYYSYKFVYDSFSLSFMNELVDVSYPENLLDENLKINFITSRNIVSKFAFMFPQYKLKYSLMDYDNVVNVSRNNEQVLYNSQYINYLRTGYNYDLKSKQRQEQATGTGIGLSAVGTIAGVALGMGTSNPLITAGAIISGAISLSSQLISYAKSMAESEQGLERKLKELQESKVSVMNADDIDLLNAYSNNRAKLCLYEISPLMKSALCDLFYYCGYSTYEQKIPKTDTRYWFNFIQCDLDITGVNSNLSSDIIEEIKNKFKDGTTFFHYHAGQTTMWDIGQEKENWETSLL